MSRKIAWSDLAEKDIEQQLVYLTREWDVQVGINFLERVDEVLIAVEKNPSTYYQIDSVRHIHKFIVNKYIVLYYQVTPQTIYLITFWDGRQDETKLAERLKDIK